VPIWKISSPPLRWYGERPPSPVFCRQPAIAAPRFRASTACGDREPKLIAEMFTMDRGRNCWARSRGPPRIFADGSVSPSPACASDAGAMSANVRCLMIG
jgi:hypothetical protein